MYCGIPNHQTGSRTDNHVVLRESDGHHCRHEHHAELDEPGSDKRGCDAGELFVDIGKRIVRCEPNGDHDLYPDCDEYHGIDYGDGDD